MRQYLIILMLSMLFLTISSCNYEFESYCAYPIEEHDFIGLTGIMFGVIADILAIPSLIFLSFYYKRKCRDPQYSGPVRKLIILSYVLYVIGLLMCIPNCKPVMEIQYYFLFSPLYVIFILAHIIIYVRHRLCQA